MVNFSLFFYDSFIIIDFIFLLLLFLTAIANKCDILKSLILMLFKLCFVFASLLHDVDSKSTRKHKKKHKKQSLV
ncbi:hypothetical protein [Helicobacter fennelliae]|uniref:Uncharacterized protein n=1 Tax=Helicobacter fennelliae MRY12-0050 TaxID=1325130 RepID=T1D2S4_9HELI|nr:hypothetical protein [Helicobacter fennelliae]GAD19491.1 hypothetical protein HFN_0731 [Helicobacter fennelliae MRY12-0050]